VGHGYGRTKTEAKASCVTCSRAGLDLAVMLEFLGSLTVALIGSRWLPFRFGQQIGRYRVSSGAVAWQVACPCALGAVPM
jgi:hypothetical protein